VEYNRQLWKQAEQASLEKVKAGGVTVIRPDKKPFQQAVQSMWRKYEDTELGALMQQIRETE